MRRYETIVIVDPDVGDEQREPVFDRIRELIPQQNGLLVKIDNWGTKKLAYAIKKKVRGFYSRIDYCGSGPLVDEIERFFRIDDRVLKFMTVMLDEMVDPEKIQEEIARAAAQEAPASPTPETGAAQPPVEPAEAEAKPTDPVSAPVESNQEES
ncbi:MAG: 30S ribosomal protein S6 [Thermodesulfobacteriota bacterium]